MIGGMMGVQIHPALKVVIGVALTGLGVTRDHAAALVVLGVVLFVWGAVAWVASALKAGDEPQGS